MDTIRILRGRVDNVTFSETIQCIREFLTSQRTHHIITANTLMLLEAEQDKELQSILDNASLVVPESWGVYWASRQIKSPLKEFTPGIDLMASLCSMSEREKNSVFLLGGKPGIAALAAQKLKTIYPKLRVAGTHHGYFSASDEKDIIAFIRKLEPSFLFVGMSVPGQEKWIARNIDKLGTPIVMGVGGSFDVLSGNLKRAPLWMRKIGIEWVYRTMQEPWRIQRIKNLPVFMWRVLYTKNR